MIKIFRRMKMKNINVFILLLFIFGVFPNFLVAAQYSRSSANQVPFVKGAEYNQVHYASKFQNVVGNSSATTLLNKQQPQPVNIANKNLPNKQQNNSVTKIYPLPMPPKPTKKPIRKTSNVREVQFSDELFDIRILEDEEEEKEKEKGGDNLVLPQRVPEVVLERGAVVGEGSIDDIKVPKVITPIVPNHVPSAGFLQYSDEYPDPRRVGITKPYVRGGISPVPYGADRSAVISEEEVHHRHHVDMAREQSGLPPVTAAECPLCKDDPKTPCGNCSKCKLGYPCERAVCRHCVQPVSRNLNNFCDLTVSGEPCGTCDSCREHRSDPCDHADDGRGPHGEWNPYKQSRIFSVIPRPILDEWNNGARKFPVYYNPAPYYRPYWNPSLYTGYARPYTFRYTCPVCSDGVCRCNKPPFAGQVPFAYACKFCNRNPCACAEDICDANVEMIPSGRSSAIDAARSQSTRIQDAEFRNQNDNNRPNTSSDQTSPGSSNDVESDSDLLELFGEKPKTSTTPYAYPPVPPPPPTPRDPSKRQLLDAPKTQPTNIIPKNSIIN
jgi:hypothetical protein